MEREEHNIKDIVQDADERAFVCLEGESKQSLVPPPPPQLGEKYLFACTSETSLFQALGQWERF